jgi:tRNA-(ms[2]io[6]A)-hydroxylase
MNAAAAELAAETQFAHPLLRAATPSGWIAQACATPDVLLIDHANCEKKAASTALALMFAYAEDLELTDRLSRLAREELRHYEHVAKLIRVLGMAPRRLAPGRYAERLRRLVAKVEPQREVDLMVCGAVIEARSCERFAALAPAIGGAAGELFSGLHAAEARHYRVYLDLAKRAASRSGIALGARMEEFAACEAALITSRDDEFRFHSGNPQAQAPGEATTPIPDRCDPTAADFPERASPRARSGYRRGHRP